MPGEVAGLARNFCTDTWDRFSWETVRDIDFIDETLAIRLFPQHLELFINH